MSTFETVVRPAVVPNIRPGASGVAAKGGSSTGAAIGGAGGRLIDLVHSRTDSVQRQGPHEEQQRIYDTDRVHQKQEDGTINKKNFVDMDRLTGVELKDSEGNKLIIKFSEPPVRDNVENKQKGQVWKAGTASSGGGESGGG